ncbi:toxin-antitoxin system YwqK family antitoxin [Flavobacterium sp.]|uniref:toxin-antitoxin system YwqK family antitoxin n=1 Tax=Flavobacterium sp. TaxID=239 RepID=UPI0040471064
MKKIFIIAIISFLLVSFTDPYTIKRVSDKEFRYEFYTTDKKGSIKNTKHYYWFKGGKVHNTQGGIAGQLLNEEFKKFYHTNQLAEQGKFKKGLKVGQWKTWYENGTLATTQKYCGGLSNGAFVEYDSKGNLVAQGKFKKGKKHGFWINHIAKDTIQYKSGKVFVPKPKLTKEEKAIEKIQKKKDREALKLKKEEVKEAKKIKREQKKNQSKEVNPSATEGTQKAKKDNFFSRLFSKKEK